MTEERKHLGKETNPELQLKFALDHKRKLTTTERERERERSVRSLLMLGCRRRSPAH